jgi:predicted phosphodiesterase
MKLLVLGDIHGRFDRIQRAYETEKPDAILHVGDLAAQEYAERRLNVGEYPASLPPVPFVWVLGNHENLKTYSAVGTPLGFFGATEIAGIKIVGLGGIPGGRREVHWGVNGALEGLKNAESTDILLTHEACPFTHSQNGQEMGSVELQRECRRLRPKYHFSGHHHFAKLEEVHGVVHYMLPYAWDGYAVYQDGNTRLVETGD